MTRLRLAFALAIAAMPLPAVAQDRATIDQRVTKVEKELRAVQRKVFPNGNTPFFEPEIAPAANQAPAGLPASTPLNDLTARVDALEKSVAQMTGQVEQAEHRLTLLSEQAAKDRAEFDARLKAIEAAAAPAPAPVETGEAPVAAPPARPPARPAGTAPRPFPPVSATTAPVRAGAAAATAATRPATATIAPAPAARDREEAPVAASGDAAEDAYMAGYKLWADKKYAQARTSLRAFVAKYPKHKRASYAQNLLGRAYLDDNQPASAAEAFAANYQTNPRGERAPDSLYFLGQSLMKLGKPADACRVYDELDAAYGDKVEGSLKARVAAGRKEAKCKAS